jgi:predicted ATPase
LICAVAPLSPDQLNEALARLIESGLAFGRGAPPQSTYTFKHALVQDTAYDSLLKSKRAQLHAQIAQILERDFSDRVANEPEVLAHHLTMAGQTEDAIPLWQKAGELALSRRALTEAIAHLNKGLELIASLPPSVERDASELALRISLGLAWLALKGWAAPELWNSLRPALSLAKSLGRDDALVPIYWCLVDFVVAQGRAAEAVTWAQEMLDEANGSGDVDFVVQGHLAVCICCYFTGNLTKARMHANKLLALYDDGKHHHIVKLINNDPKTAVSAHLSQVMWRLGFPDQAVRFSNQAVDHARVLGHPFNLGHALTIGSDVFDFRSDADELRKCAEEVMVLGQENNLPFLSGYLAPSRNGIALLREGKIADGIMQLKAGLAVWDDSGGKIRSPYLKSVLAGAMASIGEADDALKLLDEQIEQVERPGWEERVDYAEILRIKGSVLLLKDDIERAEEYFLKSLDVAREQQAKSWELRASTSLARLWQGQDKEKEAHDLLKPVYDWFTEGFHTRDLKEAKALLDELEVTA